MGFAIGALAVLLAAGLAGCSSPPLAATEPAPVYMHKWGAYGQGAGQFNYHTGVAVDATGNVYVTDSGNNRIQKFGPGGALLTQWGTTGAADGQFQFPTGITVGPAGTLYVIDSKNYRIQVFTQAGGFVGKWGSAGAADGQFVNPRGIGVDAAGNVFVSDYSNHRVQKFTSTGTFLLKWGSPGTGDGQFQVPRGVAVDPFGAVFVADYGNDRVQKFDGNGVFLGKWGTSGIGSGEFDRPYGVTTDVAGNVFVTDVHNHRVQKFTGYGAYLSKWGKHGAADGMFDEPFGVAVDGLTYVYVVDGVNDRVQKFRYPVADTIFVQATLDGATWNGPVAFTVAGPQPLSGAVVPFTSAAVAPGTYAAAYASGGPPGAVLVGATPLTQTFAAGGSGTFTLAFRTPSHILVTASLDGSPWSGPVAFSLAGPQAIAGTAVPSTSSDVAAGAYTLAYVSGGPAGASLAGIGPAATATAAPGTTAFALNFLTPGGPAGTGLAVGNPVIGTGPDDTTAYILATLDGAPWSGPLSYHFQGALDISFGFYSGSNTVSPLYAGASVPQVYTNLEVSTSSIHHDPVTLVSGPGGMYSVVYLSGGPPGAAFVGITPAFPSGLGWQILVAGHSKTFTLDFQSPGYVPPSAIGVVATLDGAPWTGPLAFSLAGPQAVLAASAPWTIPNAPAGAYSVAYQGGGPPGAALTATLPSATQTHATGTATIFTLAFTSGNKDAGTAAVQATLDGVPWNGPVAYNLNGPVAKVGTQAPTNHINLAPGSYTLTYTSGGPSGATFTGVASSATQAVAVGGTTTFTLQFRSAEPGAPPPPAPPPAPAPTAPPGPTGPDGAGGPGGPGGAGEGGGTGTGTVYIEATMAGAAGAAPWTGPVAYSITGPYGIGGASVPQTNAGVPTGTYTIVYESGGPPDATLTGITPSATQTLGPGGSITFRLAFA